MVENMRHVLSNLELRGPRNITSSNIDRCFDDNGRFLFVEEKNDRESMPNGQRRMLLTLSHQHDVWIVKGSPDRLKIWTLQDGEHAVLAEGSMSTYQSAVFSWFEGAA